MLRSLPQRARSVAASFTAARSFSAISSPLGIIDMPTIVVASLPVTDFAMNQYLLICKETKEAAIVDAGDIQPDKWVTAAKNWDSDVKYLLQTHAHIDHVAGLAETKALLPDAPIYLHPDDDDLLARVHEQGKMFGVSCAAAPPADIAINDGDVVAVGNLQLQVLHTPGENSDGEKSDGDKRLSPLSSDSSTSVWSLHCMAGHCPGHCCFYIEKEGVMFGGDLIFQGSIGRTDLPWGCDWNQMESSLARIMRDLPDDAAVLPGHMGMTTIGQERRTNPFLQNLP